MQGSVITVPYCFLNTEVRATLRNSYHRWKLNRNINGGGAGGGAGLGGSGAAGAGTCMSESRWGETCCLAKMSDLKQEKYTFRFGTRTTWNSMSMTTHFNAKDR